MGSAIPPNDINKNWTKYFPAYLIDPQGFGAHNEDINNDNKILLLAILISPLLIYNSFGIFGLIGEVTLKNEV